MFIGEYTHSIDEKNRLSIPAKFRSKLAGGCIVTRGLDKCLWIYPLLEWEKLAEKISTLPITQKNARSFSRLMFAGATDASPDKSGRVIIPKYLLDYASIKNKVAVNGIYDRIEIWSSENWDSFKKEMEENSDEVAENLTEIGF